MGSIKQLYTKSVDEKNDSGPLLPHNVSKTILVKLCKYLNFFFSNQHHK